MKTVLATHIVLLFLAGIFVSALTPPVAAAVPGSYDFSFVWMSDTQVYSESYPSIYDGMTQWIVNNKAGMKIQYAIHTGDIVNTAGTVSEWLNADHSMDILDNGNVPYGVLAGNHDGQDGFVNYHTYFGSARFQSKSYYHNDASGNNDNHYDLITANGVNFVIVYLSYGTTSTERTWASSVFKTYADRIGILAIHEYLAIGGGYSGDGSALNTDVVLPNSNVWLVVCGHNHSAVLNVKTAGSRTYYELMSDYQSLANGGNGYQKIFYFDVAHNNVHVMTYSTVLSQYGGTGYGYDEFDMPLPQGVATYTVTFHADHSGTIAADGVVKSDGGTGVYGAGSSVHVVANAPSGYSFSSWETSGGVSVAPADSSVVLFLGMDGADGSTSFPDGSGSNHVMTAVGNAQVDTGQSRFGGGSGLFDGAGDYVSTPDSADWAFGTGDFTVDFWVRFNALPTSGGNPAGVFGQYTDDNNFFYAVIYNTGGGYGWGLEDKVGGVYGPVVYGATSVSTGVWYHVAYVRSGSNWYIFQDGVPLSLYVVTNPSYSMGDFTGSFNVGVGLPLWGQYLNGWIDEFRVSKGLARWTTSFTPPTVSQKPTAAYDAYMTVSGTGSLTAHFTAGTPPTWVSIGGLTPSRPAACWFNSHLYMIVRDNGADPQGSGLWMSSMDSTGVWSNWIPIGGLTPSAPACAAFNNRLYLFVRDANGNLWMRSMNTGGVWSAWTALGGSSPSSPAVAAFNGYLYLAVRGASPFQDAIWLSRMSAGETWSGWTQLDGLTPDSPSLAAFNNHLYMVVEDVTGGIWMRSMDTTEAWSSWSPLGGLTSAPPSMAAYGGELYLFVKDISGGIWSNTMDTSGTWSGWVSPGGLTTSGPVGCATDTSLYVIVNDIVGGLWVNRIL